MTTSDDTAQAWRDVANPLTFAQMPGSKPVRLPHRVDERQLGR